MQVLVNFPCRLLCARNRQPESTKSAPPGKSLMVRECQRSCRSVAFGRMCGHTNRLKPTLWLPTNRIDKIRSVSRVDHRFVCELGCLNFRCLPASVTVFRMCVRPRCTFISAQHSRPKTSRHESGSRIDSAGTAFCNTMVQNCRKPSNADAANGPKVSMQSLQF